MFRGADCGGPEAQITMANKKTQQKKRGKHHNKLQNKPKIGKTQQQIKKRHTKSQNTTANRKTQ